MARKHYGTPAQELNTDELGNGEQPKVEDTNVEATTSQEPAAQEEVKTESDAKIQEEINTEPQTIVEEKTEVQATPTAPVTTVIQRKWPKNLWAKAVVQQNPDLTKAELVELLMNTDPRILSAAPYTRTQAPGYINWAASELGITLKSDPAPNHATAEKVAKSVRVAVAEPTPEEMDAIKKIRENWALNKAKKAESATAEQPVTGENPAEGETANA
jgi:hypothetical protein